MCLAAMPKEDETPLIDSGTLNCNRLAVQMQIADRRAARIEDCSEESHRVAEECQCIIKRGYDITRPEVRPCRQVHTDIVAKCFYAPQGPSENAIGTCVAAA